MCISKVMRLNRVMLQLLQLCIVDCIIIISDVQLDSFKVL